MQPEISSHLSTSRLDLKLLSMDYAPFIIEARVESFAQLSSGVIWVFPHETSPDVINLADEIKMCEQRLDGIKQRESLFYSIFLREDNRYLGQPPIEPEKSSMLKGVPREESDFERMISITAICSVAIGVAFLLDTMVLPHPQYMKLLATPIQASLVQNKTIFAALLEQINLAVSCGNPLPCSNSYYAFTKVMIKKRNL